MSVLGALSELRSRGGQNILLEAALEDLIHLRLAAPAAIGDLFLGENLGMIYWLYGNMGDILGI